MNGTYASFEKPEVGDVVEVVDSNWDDFLNGVRCHIYAIYGEQVVAVNKEGRTVWWNPARFKLISRYEVE